MHTEHLQNVGIGRVGAGWLVAIAVTSLVVFVFEASGLGTVEGPANTAATIVSVVVGFAAGGFFTGFLARRAPILHGVGVGLVSVVVWVLIDAVAAAFARGYTSDMGVTLAIGIVMAMIAAAIVGALIGYNLALRGRPGLSEDVPVDSTE